jgi:DnaJ-class molecular chaperone
MLERAKPKTCPECKGKKGYNRQITKYWEEPPQYEWIICPECNGQGVVSALAMLIYKARGGTAPKKMQIW